MVHRVYLSLGSNIQPEENLPKAINLLSERGKILKLSSAWESRAVGSNGPNFLNACVLFSTQLLYAELKAQVAHPIEAQLGRKRTEDKYAPRTIDIDIILFDNESCNEKFWNQAQ
jgi:2-amino-4-hydroxy-6-hydroxymethyldihydropteridine pyrophosphokinase